MKIHFVILIAVAALAVGYLYADYQTNKLWPATAAKKGFGFFKD